MRVGTIIFLLGQYLFFSIASLAKDGDSTLTLHEDRPLLYSFKELSSTIVKDTIIPMEDQKVSFDETENLIFDIWHQIMYHLTLNDIFSLTLTSRRNLEAYQRLPFFKNFLTFAYPLYQIIKKYPVYFNETASLKNRLPNELREVMGTLCCAFQEHQIKELPSLLQSIDDRLRGIEKDGNLKHLAFMDEAQHLKTIRQSFEIEERITNLYNHLNLSTSIFDSADDKEQMKRLRSYTKYANTPELSLLSPTYWRHALLPPLSSGDIWFRKYFFNPRTVCFLSASMALTGLTMILLDKGAIIKIPVLPSYEPNTPVGYSDTCHVFDIYHRNNCVQWGGSQYWCNLTADPRCMYTDTPFEGSLADHLIKIYHLNATVWEQLLTNIPPPSQFCGGWLENTHCIVSSTAERIDCIDLCQHGPWGGTGPNIYVSVARIFNVTCERILQESERNQTMDQKLIGYGIYATIMSMLPFVGIPLAAKTYSVKEFCTLDGWNNLRNFGIFLISSYILVSFCMLIP